MADTAHSHPFTVDGETLTLRVPQHRLFGRKTRQWPRMILGLFACLLTSYAVLPLLVWLLKPHLDGIHELVHQRIPAIIGNFLVIYVASTILMAAFG